MRKLKPITIFILSVIFFSSQAKEYKKLNNQANDIIYDISTVNPNSDTWSSVKNIISFYDSENADPVETDASVQIVFDGKNLIFKVDAPELNHGKALQKCYLSDELDLRNNPNISIFLDPEHNHGVYYRFIVDSNGNKQDLRVDDESWWANWSAKVDNKSNRINAEIKIPIEKITKENPEGKIWGFNMTIDGIVDNGTVSSTPIIYRLADANYFGHLLFNGDLAPKTIAEIKASLPEIHKNQNEEKLATNVTMCGPELQNIEGEIKQITVGQEIALKNGKKITCIGLDNEKIERSDYPFFYEKFENERLQKLRKQYCLEDIIETGKNDFEKILLLNEWLYNHVKFGTPPPIRPDALHILEHGLNGQTFYCTYLSFTLMQMLNSLGYTARKLTSVGHGTLDVWSSYWRKWIQIDPSRRSYFRLKGTAVPLNSNEIRREFWKNKGVDMEMVYGTEQRAERVTLETRKRDGLMRYRPDSYQWVAYKTRNNFFEVPFAYWNFDYLIIEDEINSDKIWSRNNITDIRETLGTRTNKTSDVFWTLNQAYIHLYDEGSNILKVQLETVTPNFETFEYSIDDGDWYNTNESSHYEGKWRKTEPILTWELHKGQNILSARSVNKFGVRGQEYKVVLLVE